MLDHESLIWNRHLTIFMLLLLWLYLWLLCGFFVVRPVERKLWLKFVLPSILFADCWRWRFLLELQLVFGLNVCFSSFCYANFLIQCVMPHRVLPHLVCNASSSLRARIFILLPCRINGLLYTYPNSFECGSQTDCIVTLEYALC